MFILLFYCNFVNAETGIEELYDCKFNFEVQLREKKIEKREERCEDGIF